MGEHANARVFAALLRQHRLERGLTQEQVAEIAGLSARSIQDLERALASPRRGTLERLVGAFGLSGERRTAFEDAARPRPRQRVSGSPAPTTIRTNLRRELTSFIGRQREVSELRGLLDTAPLVTVTGPGGVGKTRLAVHVAAAGLSGFPDGVWLVELAALSTDDSVVQAVASALDVHEQPRRALQAEVIDRLQQRRLLLVLDNCERLVSRCATLAEDLLRACPDLTVLATSREPLGISGEVVFQVPPLADAEGVQLFVDRARLVAPEFERTRRHDDALTRVCHSLEGLPLSIELAAARVNVLSVEELAARLGDRLHLRAAGARSRPARHQSLRAAIDWSFDLLCEHERQLLARLSVFVGGWTLGAAEAVCSSDELPSETVLDALTRLVQCSLVHVAARQDGGPTRYRLLDSVRQYAAEWLVRHGAVHPCRWRHAAYYMRLTEDAAALRHGARDLLWVETLAADYDNVRAALAWCLEADEVEGALRMASELFDFWELRGELREGLEWLDRGLASSVAVDLAVRARALNSAGSLAALLGEHQRAEARYTEALALYRALSDRRGIIEALSNIGILGRMRGRLDEAEQVLTEALGVSRSADAQRETANLLANLSRLSFSKGNLELGEAYGRESLAMWRSLGDLEGIAFSLGGLGWIAHTRGDFAMAEVLGREYLDLARASGFRSHVCDALCILGETALLQGDCAQAAELVQEALALRLADQAIHQSIDLLAVLASVALSADLPERAATLIAAYSAACAQRGIQPRPVHADEHRRVIAATRAALGEPAFAAAWSRGEALSVSESMTYALQPMRVS